MNIELINPMATETGIREIIRNDGRECIGVVRFGGHNAMVAVDTRFCVLSLKENEILNHQEVLKVYSEMQKLYNQLPICCGNKPQDIDLYTNKGKFY